MSTCIFIVIDATAIVQAMSGPSVIYHTAPGLVSPLRAVYQCMEFILSPLRACLLMIYLELH